MTDRAGHPIVFALRQAAVLTACLLIGGQLVARLRPDELADRGFDSTPFWWSAVAWTLVLVVASSSEDRNAVSDLGGLPFAAATGIAVVVFAQGVLTVDAGATGPRVVYLAANAVGALVFWWAIIGLVALLTRVVRGRSENAIATESGASAVE